MKSLFEELKMYENLWDAEINPLKEEAEFRSEFARLMSTPEGREQFNALSLEDRMALRKADREVDPVEKLIRETPDIELEYDGFEDDWYRDCYDPGSSYGHYQVGGTSSYPDFTYSIDASEMLETLEEYIFPKYIDKVANNELLDTYRKLNKAVQDAPEISEDAAVEALDLFILKNLQAFVDMFLKQITEHYYEDAYEWAREHCEPYDYD